MLMIAMSLAISLVSIQSFYALTQQEGSSNQTPQNQRLQQESKDATMPTIPPNVRLPFPVKPIALLPGDDAWAVQIASRDGRSGPGTGDLVVTSEGTLTWSGAGGACSGRLTDEAIRELAKLVLPPSAPAFWEAQLSGRCGDCYVVTMILQRRGDEGVVRTSVVSWDNVSAARVSEKMMALYEKVAAYRRCKLQ